jgi:hypothetical protein
MEQSDQGHLAAPCGDVPSAASEDAVRPVAGVASTEQESPRCLYCSKPMHTPVTRRIIDRGWDSVRRKQYVRERDMQFCSAQCGGNYQMGCEG